MEDRKVETKQAVKRGCIRGRMVKSDATVFLTMGLEPSLA